MSVPPTDVGGSHARGLPEDEGPVFDLRGLVGAIRRRWWLLLLFPAISLGVAAWILGQRVPQYTAEVMFRQQGGPPPGRLQGELSQLARLGLFDAGTPPEFIVLRTRSVLQPVVDALGLQVRLGPEHRRSDLFRQIEVRPGARSGKYELVPRGDAIELRIAGSDQPLDRAPRGGTLTGPGFRLTLEPGSRINEPVELTVAHPEATLRRLRAELRLEQVGGSNMTTPAGSNVTTARYSDPDPNVAHAVLTHLVASYESYLESRGMEDARRRLAFIEQQLRAAQDSLREAQEVLLRRQETLGRLSSANESAALVTALVEAEQRLREVQYDEEVLRALSGALESSELGADDLRRAVILGREVVPSITGLYDRLRSLETQRAQLTASRFGRSESGMEVEVLDSLIADTRSEMRSLVDQTLEVTPARREHARMEVEDLRNRIRSMPAQDAQFARMEQRVQRLERIYDMLWSQHFDARIAETVAPRGVEIVDPAVVPYAPDPAPAGRVLFIALAGGLLLGLAVPLGLELGGTRVRNTQDAQDTAHLHVLGRIPQLRGPAANGAGRLPALTTLPAAEAFRGLRAVLGSRNGSTPHVIAVTSPELEDGKSLVAANLAASYVRGGRRVLLVDADLRRPSIHSLLGVEREPGLTDVLLGAVGLEAATQRHGSGLAILTAGRRAEDGVEELAGDAFRELVEEARRSYDMLVIDTPPVMAVPDAAAMAPAVEGVLMVARIGQTDRRKLQGATQRMQEVGANLIGMVVNAVPEGEDLGYSTTYVEGEEGPPSRRGLRRILQGLNPVKHDG